MALSGHPNGVWLSILIAISGIAYYYWMGTEDMAAVYVAAGIMVLAGVGVWIPWRLQMRRLPL